MSYNGTGTFNINTAGQPVVTGTTITSTAFNLLTADLATGLTTALTKDGQTTPTANIPMGSFKITGLGAGTSATDAAQYGQLQAGATTIATVTGTDTLTGSVTPALAAYATGNLFSFVAASTNTGAATINLNSLGAKNITKQGTTALIAGDIASGRVHLIEYDGTRFQLLNPESSTGTGASVFATSPTLVTPILGTPTSATLTNATGLPIASGVSGLGTGVATALAVNVGSSGAPLVNGGVLGTPSSGTVTNLTGTASININGTVGATTPSTGAFTTLSATGVTSLQAGSAGVPALIKSGDTDTGIFFPAADTFALTTGGSERMRITSAGFVGINTTTPGLRAQVNGVIGGPATSGTTQTGIMRLSQGSGSAVIDFGVRTSPDVTWIQATDSNNLATNYNLCLNPNGGSLLVGTTSQISDGKITVSYSGASNNALVLSETANSNSVGYIFFSQGSTTIGSITRVGVTSAVIYNTTSDYRLKTVTGAVTGQGSRIDALKPVDYLWKEGNSQARGFLAHEFQTVYPNSVTGEKDNLDADGNPKYQSMQASSSEVIADLVAEIQSLRVRVAQLETN